MRGYQSRRRLFLESLETRKMLAAAGGAVEFEGGVLSILGSNKNDQIHVSVTDTLLTVRLNKQTFEFEATGLAEVHIDGGKGNDRICVDGSVLANATIAGGDGNDHVYGGGGSDTITGDRGNDRLYGGGGNDTVNGGLGNDWAWGDDGDDVLHGDEGNDHVFGGAGLDELFGDAGHDHLHGGEDDDVLHGGLGKDHLHGDAGNDQLFGDENKDHLWGDDGNDQLFGGDDKDHLWGGLGDDELKGEAGNDHLDGGEGTNLLDGDEGNNHFKNGTIVDLDQQVLEPILVAQLTDTSGSGIVGQASVFLIVENGMEVQQLTITVENVPPSQDGTPVSLQVIVGEGWLGDITVDPLTGKGSLTVSGIFIEAGYPISVGGVLTGSFVAP